MEKETFVLKAFQAIKKKFSLLLLITAVFTILGGVVSLFLNKNLYESTVTFTFGVETTRDTEEVNSVTGEPIKETYIQFGTYSVYNESYQFYKELLRSDDLLDEVINSLNLDLTNSELEESIKLINPEGSGTLLLTVQLDKYENTDEIANEVASVFERKNLEITDLDNIKVINSASKPRVINTKNIKLNIVLSAVSGLVVGTILVILLDYFDVTNRK